MVGVVVGVAGEGLGWGVEEDIPRGGRSVQPTGHLCLLGGGGGPGAVMFSGLGRGLWMSGFSAGGGVGTRVRQLVAEGVGWGVQKETLGGRMRVQPMGQIWWLGGGVGPGAVMCSVLGGAGGMRGVGAGGDVGARVQQVVMEGLGWGMEEEMPGGHGGVTVQPSGH